MKTIPLTQGQVALVDDKDFERFCGFRWSAVLRGKRWYAVRSGPRPSKKIIYLHRAILGVTDYRVKVDHRDHDGLNCLRENLRACTNAQNMQNQSGLQSSNTSGFRGVSLHADTGRWVAFISIRGRQTYLGLFSDKASAAQAYAAANRKHFGSFGGKF